MGQIILAIIGTIIGGIILLNIEYNTFVPRTVDEASKSEHKLNEIRRQAAAEEEAASLQARMNARRLEQENRAKEAALRLEQERAQKEEARRQRQRQAEADRRARQEYIDQYRRTHHGCDPGTNRYCTYVQGQPVGCSCM